MKRLLGIAFAAGLLLMPVAGYTGYGQDAGDAPPVAPTLVREGDFAVKLVETLKVGTAENEAQAEKMLAEAGIAPKNGWISDYPVTPDVLGDVRATVELAAESGKIVLSKADALKGFDDLAASLGLQVKVAAGDGDTAKVTTEDYMPPEAVEDYYSEEGPPVVTYYAPPPDYYYLYNWVPYPFFCSDFFFRGYFVLRHFTLNVVVVNGHAVVFNARNPVIVAGGVRRVVSNVVISPATKRTLIVDPVHRRLVGVTGGTATFTRPNVTTGATSNWRGADRKAAESILGRRVQRGQATVGGAGVATRPDRVWTRESSTTRVPTAVRPFSNPAPIVRSEPVRSFSNPAPIVRSEPVRSFSNPAPIVRSEPVRTFSNPAPIVRGRGIPGGVRPAGRMCFGNRC